MRVFYFLALAFLTSPLYAKEIKIEFLHAYDGDTIYVNLPDLKALDKQNLYELFWKNISVRIGGIDTPEMKGECAEEKELAKKAKAFVEAKLRAAKKITIDEVDKDKYFRILAEVYVDGVPLSQMILDEGLGIPYDGGTKKNPWCKAATAPLRASTRR